MSEDDPLFSPDRLAEYEVPGAPRGFASRVMAAVAAPPHRRRWPLVAAAGAVVASAATAIALVRGSGEHASGARVASARETVTLGGRGVAVAEAGTALSWTIGSDAVVEQSSGRVFYRVEHSGPFEVRTPLGDVQVTGTCFAVEIIMKNPINRDVMKGAGLGAVLATAVVVTVYEGGVTFANPSGRVHVAPGETATARTGEPPRIGGTATTLAVDVQNLDEARAKIAELQGQLAVARGDRKADTDPRHGDPGRYYDPSPDTLREMAATCWIAFDQPPPADNELVDGDLASTVGVSTAERAAINEAYRKVQERELDAIRKLYMELTGADADATAPLSFEALDAEIKAKTSDADEIAARRNIARARAGLDPEPSPAELAHRSAIERMIRIRMRLGAEAEAAAASVVGAARAHDLRTHNGVGWRNTVSDYGGCDKRF